MVAKTLHCIDDATKLYNGTLNLLLELAVAETAALPGRLKDHDARLSHLFDRALRRRLP